MRVQHSVFYGFVGLIVFSFALQFLLFFNPTPNTHAFSAITGIATPAFYSQEPFLRHPFWAPPSAAFTAHPELPETFFGSFIQTRPLP